MREKKFYREQLNLLNELYPQKVALTVEETARALGVDRRTIRALIINKQLPATNISLGRKNKVFLIPKIAVASFSAG